MVRDGSVGVNRGSDRRTRFAPRLAVGLVMPCHAFTERLLLLAAGERIESETQLRRLLRDDVIFSDHAPPQLARAVRERQKALGIIPAAREREAQDAENPADAALESLADTAPGSPPQPTPFAIEVAAARRLRAAAMRQVRALMEQARAGQDLDLEPVRGTVRQVVRSVCRNRRAFLSLLRLKSLDSYTYTHSLNNCVLAILLAQHSGLAADAEMIGLGALLHDIGKVRLPESLLHKPDHLTEQEWALVKRHPIDGLEIVHLSPDSERPALDAIAEHHERLDGSGYPRGLAAPELSAAGRIVAITDVYDAMTSDRPYHPAIAPPDAMRWIFQHANHQFDSSLTRVFVETIGLFPIGSLVRLNTGELALVASVNPRAIRRPTVIIVSEPGGVPIGEPRVLDLDQPAALSAGREIAAIEDARQFPGDIDACLHMLPALSEDVYRSVDLLA